ncbi:hypothetical protein MNBD_GAMMA02-749, partial [hydrothermal vent metagenome]
RWQRIFYIHYTHQVIALYFAFLYRDSGRMKQLFMGSNMLLLEISASKQLKLMRSAHSEKIKKATLTPRRLFDFVSPKHLNPALRGLHRFPVSASPKAPAVGR